jgi:hypothetical protein
MDESENSAAREESVAATAPAELIIPPARLTGIVRLVLQGGFVAFGLATVCPFAIGVANALRQRPHVDLGGFAILAAIGTLVALLFGAVLVQEVRALRSPGLRLTTDGYEVNGRRRAWADVAEIQLVGTAYFTSHIVVKYVPGTQLSRGEKVSEALRWLGYFPPTYIARSRFNTGGQPLERILRQWWLADGYPAASAVRDVSG